jgi:hypothetical protein
VAEIPPKKLKKGWGENGSEELDQKWQKKCGRKFSKEFSYFTVMTNTQRHRQNLSLISN